VALSSEELAEKRCREYY